MKIKQAVFWVNFAFNILEVAMFAYHVIQIF